MNEGKNEWLSNSTSTLNEKGLSFQVGWYGGARSIQVRQDVRPIVKVFHGTREITQ